MKKSTCYLLITIALFCTLPAFATGVRWDLGTPGSAGVVQVNGGSGYPPIFAVPNAILNFCSYPANAVPCTNFVTTYTDLNLGTSCPTNQQVVLQGSTSCQATSDQNGALGINIAASGTYSYTLTVNGVTAGPYTVTIGGGGGGGGGGISGLTTGVIPQASSPTSIANSLLDTTTHVGGLNWGGSLGFWAPSYNATGGATGVVSLGCSGTDPGVGSGVALTVANGGCTPYTIYFPSTPSGGYQKCTNAAGKVTCVWETAIDLVNDVGNILQVGSGGTGNATPAGALINLFPVCTVKGCTLWWNGSNWTLLNGCATGAGICFYTQTGAGVPSQLPAPLPIAYGGTATATPSLVAGSNVTITGSWPNQTVASSGGGGGGGGNGAAGSSGTGIVLSGTSYAPMFGGYSTIITTAANAGQSVGGAAQAVSNLSVTLSNALSGSQTLIVTLYDVTLAAAEAVTCTVPNSGTTCTDTTHSYSVPAGDLVAWKAVLNTSTDTSNVVIGSVIGAASSFSGNTTTAASATTGVASGVANTFIAADGSGNVTATSTCLHHSFPGSLPLSDQITSAGAFATTISVPTTCLANGSLITIRAHGVYTTTSTSSPKMAWEVNAGGTTGICPNPTSSTTLTTSATNGYWDLTCYIQINSASGNTAVAWGGFQYSTNTGGSGVSGGGQFVNASTVTYTTSTSETLSIQETATMVSGQSFNLQALDVIVTQ